MTPQWRNFLQQAGWYLATLIVLMIALRFMPNGVILLLMWVVALVWGAFLVTMLHRLLLNRPDAGLMDERLESYLLQAQGYQEEIETIIQTADDTKQSELQRLGKQIDTWTKAIGRLVKRINELSQNEIVRRDMDRVPTAIADIEARLKQETDPRLRTKLQHTLLKRQKQWRALQALQQTLQQAEIEVESTLSSLGTIHSQILTGQSTSEIANYKRLAVEVTEEVQRLEEHLQTLRQIRLN